MPFKVNFFSKSKKKNKKLKQRVFIGKLSKLNFFRNVTEKFYFKIGWISFLTIVLSLCFLALNRPIELINVSGDLKRVPLKSIENNTNSLRNKGFLSFNASEVKEKIESLDWVQSVEIIRQWPNKIDIKITEESLLGIWNDDLILNSSGKLYIVDKRSVPTNIPRLNGPKGSEIDVMNLFIKIDTLLTGRGLYLEALTLDVRGSWSFTIKPKIEIKIRKNRNRPEIRKTFFSFGSNSFSKN